MKPSKIKPKFPIGISDGNSKLGPIPNFSLPPGISCAKNAPCYKDGCYAQKFYRMYPSVRAMWFKNWVAMNKDMEGAFAQIHAYVSAKRPQLFRIHVGGDFFSKEYLMAWVNLCRAHPYTNFLAFTKRYDLLRVARLRNNGWPVNLQIVMSMWPGLKLPERYLRDRFPVAWMWDTDLPTLPENWKYCPGSCQKCLDRYCWTMTPRMNVVLHRH